ncbi:hypothetical protein ABG299_004108 [Salmonella enterica subsp. enterica]
MRFIYSVFLFFISFFLLAQQSDNKEEWTRYIITEQIDPLGEDVPKSMLDNEFKGKTITINNKTVTVNGLCRYSYVTEHKSSLVYWENKETLNLYRDFFNKYSVSVSDGVDNILPVKPINECPYPFSDFLSVDGVLIFIDHNRAAIFYNKNDHARLIKSEFGNPEPERKHHPQSNPDITCKDDSREMAYVYEQGAITQCFYRGYDLLRTYYSYIKNDDDNYSDFLDGIVPGKNITVENRGNTINVEYTWQGTHTLHIVQNYEGGTTEITFKSREDGTDVITKNFPD